MITAKHMARWAVKRGYSIQTPDGGYVAIHAPSSPTALRRGLAQLPVGVQVRVVGFPGKLVVEKRRGVFFVMSA